MGKLRDMFKQLSGKWSKLSKVNKAVIISITSSVIIAIIFAAVYATRVKYAVLFSGMDSKNMAKVVEQFDKSNIKYKVKGDKIYVPENQVDKLRITVASSDAVLPSHAGWELFDKQSQFGVTDTQSKVMYQRALSGEIAKAIETMQGVNTATVNLVIPEQSVFTTDKDKATAAIILKLNDGVTLTADQVKAIIALVSRSVENLPKENVEITDQYGNLLSEEASDDTSTSPGTTGTSKQLELKKEFETNLQNNVKKLLEPSFGQNKVQVIINADLDFDSKQTTTIKYDAAKVERSVQKKTTTSNDGTGTASNSGTSPVDNNMTNSINSGSAGSSQSTQNEETTNYEIPQTTEVVESAPGEVKRLSVSVLINGTLSNGVVDNVKNIVSAATGFDQTRGDIVNIASMPLNTDEQKAQQNSEKALAAGKQTTELQSLYTLLAFGIIALLFLIAIMSSLRKKDDEELADAFDMSKGQIIDSVVEDNEGQDVQSAKGLQNMQEVQNMKDVQPKIQGKNNIKKAIKPEGESYEPVLDNDEPKMTLETEIRDYAMKKPDQVTEIIKTWLSEDER